MSAKRGEISNLKERTCEILRSIIDEYIRTGRPVGSEQVCAILENAPSAATIRNEMANLSALGFITQPHISAGRIPSLNGYRFYIDNLMIKIPVSEQDKNYICGMFSGVISDPEDVLRESCEILSKITECTIVFTAPKVRDDLFIRDVKFIKISSCTCMLILIISSGIVQNQIFNCGFEINDNVISIFEEAVRKKIKDKNLIDLLESMSNIVFSNDSDDIVIVTVFEAFFRAIRKVCKTKVRVIGQENLFNFQSVSDSFLILNFLENTKFIDFLFSSSSKLKIYIGNDSGINFFSDCCVIVHKYEIGLNEGAIAIIGSTRMNYSNVLSKLDYIISIIQDMCSKILSM